VHGPELFLNGSSHPASQIKTDLPPPAQILCWLLPLLQKHTQQTNVRGWVLRSGRGQLRETGSTLAAPPATSRATNPRQHRPKDLSKTRRDIHLVEIKYHEDTRPQNQLNAAKEEHKDICNILQGASVTLHIILLGVGGDIYKTHTLQPFKELGLDSQRVKKLASKLHVHAVNLAAKLVHTRRALSSTVINSHQEPVSGQACNPLDPHWFSFPFRGGGGLRYSVPKWLLFLNLCGEWFSLPA